MFMVYGQHPNCGREQAYLGQQHVARIAVQRGHQVEAAAAVRRPKRCGTDMHERNGARASGHIGGAYTFEQTYNKLTSACCQNHIADSQQH